MSNPFPPPSSFRDPGPPPRSGDFPGDPAVEGGVVGDDAPVDRARRRRLVLLLVGAGLLVLGGGAAAAVSLFGLPGTGGDSSVAADVDSDPVPSATRSATDRDTGTPAGDGSATTGGADLAVGRNVFAPLVDPDGGPGGTAASGTGTGATTGAPTSTTPVVATVSTVTVAGPTVTNTQVVPGPTITSTRTVTSTAVAGYEVRVVSVADAASATTNVTFSVDGTSVTVAHNGSFGPAGAFTYTGYDTVEDLVAFTNGSVSVTLPVGATVVFP